MPRQVDDWLTGFLELTKNIESPEIFRTWVGISTLAAILERRNWVVWEGNTYPNMYIVLVSPAGKARKGTVMRYGRYFLDDIGVKTTAEATTREALIRRLALSKENYITSEKSVPQFHSSLTIYSEELAVFFNHNDTRMIRDLTDWFDCRDSWTYETKDRKLTDAIRNVYVNMCGATTPEILGHIMPRETISGGLASRIIFVYAGDKGQIVPIPPPFNKSLYKKLLHDGKRIFETHGQFIPSDGFLSRIYDWTFEHEKSNLFQGSLLEGYSARRRIHLMKTCMIVSISRSDEKILKEEDFDRALNILEEVEGRMLSAFSKVGENPQVKFMPEIIRVLASRGEIFYSELLDIFKQDLSPKDLLEILAGLISMKKLVREKVDGGGDVKFRYIMKGQGE